MRKGAPKGKKAHLTPKMMSEKDAEMLALHMDHIKEQELHNQVSVSSTWWAQRLALKILGVNGFDSLMGGIIMMNMIVMIIDIDKSSNEDEESTDGGMHWTEVFGWVVLFIFVCELMLRLVAFGRAFWRDHWNTCDFIIVVTDLLFSLIGLVAGDVFPVSILRVFRLSKLARVSKVLKVFPELKMLLIGLVSSVRTVFWGTLLLALFILVWAMVAVLMIHPLNKNINYEGCDRCSRAYSSVFHASLTFFQQIVAGDSWGKNTIPLIEEHPITVLFFVPAFLSMGLSVLNLMLAVVVTASQTAYEEEEEDEEAEDVLSSLKAHTDVLEICKSMDTDNSGELSKQEVFEGFSQPGEFRDAFLGLGITQEDFEIGWDVLDMDDSGSVSYKELLSFILSMKGSDQHFMLVYIKNYVTWIKDSITKQLDLQQAETMKIDNEIQETLKKVEREEEVILGDIDLALSNSKQEGPNHHALQAHRALDSSIRDRSKAKVVDIDDACQLLAPKGTSEPRVGNGTCIGDDMVVSSAQVAMEDLTQQFTNDVRKMHLDLKAILASMDAKIGQGIPLAS